MPTATPVPKSTTAFIGGIDGGRDPQGGFDSDLVVQAMKDSKN